jgi:hypothetical protein
MPEKGWKGFDMRRRREVEDALHMEEREERPVAVTINFWNSK